MQPDGVEMHPRAMTPRVEKVFSGRVLSSGCPEPRTARPSDSPMTTPESQALGLGTVVQRRPRVAIPTLGEDVTMKLTTAGRECLQYLAAVRGYAPATIATYDRTYSQFYAFLRAHNIGDEPKHFTVENVMAFCSDLGSRGVVSNTILNKLHGLSTFAEYLMKRTDHRGHPVIPSNPTRGFERPKEQQAETKFLYPQELVQFMAVEVDENTALMREVLVDTGIRAGESVDANVGDLQDVDGTIYLTLRVKGRRGANQQPASIPLSAECAESVRGSLMRRNDPPADAALLIDRVGHRFTRTQLTCLFIRLGQRAGITRLSTSPHKLRHTANVVARIAGVDAVTRAAMLNHRSMRTLARYDHLVPGETAKGRLVAKAGLTQYLAQGTSEVNLRREALGASRKPVIQ
jgi:site-specific recombinase XerD